MRKNLAIILAFGLPMVLVVVVGLSVYIPSLSVSTDYDFIYSVCTDDFRSPYSYCGNYQKIYSVDQNGKLVAEEVVLDNLGPKPSEPKYNSRLFLHDAETNQSHEITEEEAKNLNLSGMLTSPDGATVTSGYDRAGDFLFFDGGSSYAYYLNRDGARKKLNLIDTDDRYYLNNFQFVGWVIK